MPLVRARRRPLVATLALLTPVALVAACGASDTIAPDISAPAATITPNACQILSDTQVEPALQAPGPDEAAQSSASPGAAGGSAPTSAAAAASASPLPSPIYREAAITVGTGTKTAGQCTYTNPDTGGTLVVNVIPKTTLAQLGSYTEGSSQLGPALVQEGDANGLITVQKEGVVVSLALDMGSLSPSARTRRLAALATIVSGAALPSVSVATPTPSASASQSQGGGGPGVVVTGANGDVKVQETDELKFSPSTSTAKVGQVVQWTNSGTVAHNVTFDQYSSISSDTMNGGDTFEVKFTQPGTYQYHCTFHAGMNATITVSG